MSERKRKDLIASGRAVSEVSSYSHEPIEPDVLDAVRFVGTALGPFWAEDPSKGSADAAFASIADMDIDHAGAEWPFVDDAVAQGALALMQKGLTEDADDAMKWEFRRLFEGPAAKAAPPWGSVYTDYENVIFGASTLALREWVRDRGVVRATDGRKPEDHIGLMLEQMAWIAANRPELLREYLGDHLLTWVSHFLDIVEDATVHDFYRGLARLTDASLAGIRDELGVDVVEPRFYR